MAGATPADGPVLVYDDDGYIMAGLIAEKLTRDGREVTFMMPHSVVSPWTEMTLEQYAIQRRLLEAGGDDSERPAAHRAGRRGTPCLRVYGCGSGIGGGGGGGAGHVADR